MNQTTIVVIGAGNMGGSLIGGLVKCGFDPKTITAIDPSNDKLDHLNQRYGIHAATDASQALLHASVVILAVKPQVVKSIVKQHAQTFATKKPLILSIAAGIRIATITEALKTTVPIVRAMPNTPALIGYGATGLYANVEVTPSQRQLAEDIFQAVGIVAWVDQEEAIDSITALSGSGPAYFFLMMESLEKAAVQLGLSQTLAKRFIIQTCLGAAQMAQVAPIDIADLRKQVTSPGGTTEAAISVLTEGGVGNLFKKALQAAKLRACELASKS